MPLVAPSLSTRPLDVVICIDDDTYARFHTILQHLCVGLVDLVSGIRLVSSTPEAESLALGPVQTLIHGALRWPLISRRLQEIADTLSARPPTIVHAMSGRTYPLAEWLAAEFDADLVYQCNGWSDVHALAARQYADPRLVIASTAPLVEQVAALPAFNREEIDLVRMGVSCEREPTCFASEERFPSVVASARLIPENGVDVLVHAAAALVRSGRKFLLFLLGVGPEEARLRQLVRELELGATVIFAAPAGDPVRALGGADVFVQPAAERIVSARALHAMAQGIAVAAVAGGVNDAYHAGVTAEVAAAGTPGDLAAAIERFLADPAYARTLGAGAIAYVRKNHSMSAMAEGAAAVYRRMAFQRATYRIE